MKKENNKFKFLVSITILIICVWLSTITYDIKQLQPNQDNQEVEATQLPHILEGYEEVCTNEETTITQELMPHQVDEHCVFKYCMDECRLKNDCYVGECHNNCMHYNLEMNEETTQVDIYKRTNDIGCFIQSHFENITQTVCTEYTLKRRVN